MLNTITGQKRTYVVTEADLYLLQTISGALIGLNDVLLNARAEKDSVHPHSIGCIIELIKGDLEQVLNKIRATGRGAA